jgi:hypothetical protein
MAQSKGLACWLSRARLRTTFPKRQMSPGSVVIIEREERKVTDICGIIRLYRIRFFIVSRLLKNK